MWQNPKWTNSWNLCRCYHAISLVGVHNRMSNSADLLWGVPCRRNKCLHGQVWGYDDRHEAELGGEDTQHVYRPTGVRTIWRLDNCCRVLEGCWQQTRRLTMSNIWREPTFACAGVFAHLCTGNGCRELWIASNLFICLSILFVNSGWRLFATGQLQICVVRSVPGI